MSFPSSFYVGSVSSTRSSVREAIESYRRVQYLVAGSNVAPSSNSAALEGAANETSERPVLPDEENFDSEQDVQTPRPSDNDSFMGPLAWEDDFDAQTINSSLTTTSQSTAHLPRARTSDQLIHQPFSPSLVGTSIQGEDTPLLSRKVSFSAGATPAKKASCPSLEGTSHRGTASSSARRLSTSSAASVKEVPRDYAGHSTFGQTLFNSIAILLGIGMLSEPLAFSYSGWIAGTILIVSYGFISCYTAKILARIILSDSRIRSYSDIGRKAFGPKATPIISMMFCLELFTVGVILVTLYGDSLHSLIPAHSSNTYKAWGLLLLIPTVFLPLSLLSYTSILGIVSTVLLTLVVFIDGFSKKDSPGSLWSPAETDMGVKGFNQLGISFGLFMAGFSGHAVIPSLARDMMDPTQFDTMINWAFLVATCIYTAIGYAGYLMFGNDVCDEISVDLLRTPGYNPFLNTLCLWMLVLSPLSKFALNMLPLNTTIEILLGIDTSFSSPEELADKPDASRGSRLGWKRVLGIIQRISLTMLAVFVSISVPEFSALMAFIGSFSAFMLSIVGPVMAKVMIEGRSGFFDKIIIVMGVVMAIWGTISAFMSP